MCRFKAHDYPVYSASLFLLLLLASCVEQGGDGPVGGVFKETLSSKTRTEASRSSRGTAKKKSMELVSAENKH